MLIRVDYSTRYDYERAPHFVVQVLRKTPRSCDSQHVRRWGIESDVDARIRQSEDAFGNIVHTLYSEKPVDALTVSVFGEVDTSDTGGVLQGWPERQHELVFLRSTPLTAPDEAIHQFASDIKARVGLDQLHALMNAINARVGFDTGATGVTHTAAEAFSLGRGVCQDHAHIFITAARCLGIPARYVSGHLRRKDGEIDQEAAHAWVEALVDGLGWVGFDPANGLSPDENYIRVACALDYLGAAPVRGSSYGGLGERMTVELQVSSQPQTQRQQ